MGKQRQQVISRFFAPKSKPEPSPPPPPPNPAPSPIPKTTATVSFSPAKRLLVSKTLTPPSKKPRLSPPPSDVSIHQRFIDKLLEPVDTPVASKPPPLNPKYTPLEQQVVELKSRYQDVILMVEVGYRYRFFGEDAEVAARILGIVCHMDHNFLTASIPTFRLNFHVRRLVGAGYKVGVVKQTETAAIKAHGGNKVGPFTRGLSALYTRATIEAAEDLGGDGEEGLGASASNYLLCVVEEEIPEGSLEGEVGGRIDVRIGVVAVEVSTSDIIHGEFNDNVMRSGLEAVVSNLAPAEILLGNPISHLTKKVLLAYAGNLDVRVEHASPYNFADGGALAELTSLSESLGGNFQNVKVYGETRQSVTVKNHIEGFEGILSMPKLAIIALAVSVRYLKKFGFDRILHSGASFRPFCSDFEIALSADTLTHLEIVKTKIDGSLEGSLLKTMNRTCTSFGSRLFKHWVTHPLCDRTAINSRLDAVSEILDSIGCSGASYDPVQLDEKSLNFAHPEIDYLLSLVLRTLSSVPDVQRGLTRILHRTATPSEFVSVIHAILLAGKQLQRLQLEEDAANGEPLLTVKSSLLRRLIMTASSSTLTTQAAKLLSCLNKDATDKGDMMNLFITSDNQFPEVAKGLLDIQVVHEKLNLLIPKYEKQLGVQNMEFSSVSGTTHLIELPSDVKVPLNWMKVNSTKKMIRYHPPEVRDTLDELSLVKEEFLVICRATWTSFLTGFGTYYARFQAAVQALAALDCLHSLSILSRNQNYVRPEFGDDDEPCQIEIQSGRHPVLEGILGDNFVPNDTYLHSLEEHCQIITGPNMGGKSCYIRQVALIVIMAQVGSFVPALSAKLHVLDGIFTRIGVSEGILQGKSTFFGELSEASHILQNCSTNSLVIIDELGRGTSTHDGVAIAYATLHYLLEQKKCMVLFVTHYPEIMEIRHEFPASVGAYHVSYLTSQKRLMWSQYANVLVTKEEDENDITFLYKVVPGFADKSFGLNVARIAQLPSSCIKRAAFMASKLEMELKRHTRVHLAEIHQVFDNDQENGPDKFKDSFMKLFILLRNATMDVDCSNALRVLMEAQDLAQALSRKELVYIS